MSQEDEMSPNGLMHLEPDVSEITYEWHPLWKGPSTVMTVRTGKSLPIPSLLKATKQELSAIVKYHHAEPVYLGRLGFEGDQQTYHEHGGPEKTVLQYNAGHYLKWREELKDVMIKDEKKRNVLLSAGGFGENLAALDPPDSPAMDERTMCVGDVVGIGKAGQLESEMVKIRVTGPRQPCYKLNHRFGVTNMALRAQTAYRTGWMYSTIEEGNVEIGDEMVLLERPYPDWPVARIQHYLYADPRNFAAIKDLLDTLGDALVFDVRIPLETRLSKGVEDMEGRLKGGSSPETFIQYRLNNKRQETQRISEFVFERVQQLSRDSASFMKATPGSHIRLKFKLPDRDNIEVVRPYSVISGDSNLFRLGIALSDNSRGGSSFLHNTLQAGDILEVSDTFANTFPLIPPSDADKHIFLAGGIGITAFLDHIQHCIAKQLPFELHYMVRNESDIAFESDIRKMLAQAHTKPQTNGDSTRNNHNIDNSPSQLHIHISTNPTSRLSIPTLLSAHLHRPRTQIYTCGSPRLSEAVTSAAAVLSLPTSRLHFEAFTADATGDPFVAHLTKSRKTVNVRGEQSLLDALREAGLVVGSSCEVGNCATCRVKVCKGRVEHRGTGLKEEEKWSGDGEKEGEGDMLSCVSRGVGRIEIEL